MQDGWVRLSKMGGEGGREGGGWFGAGTALQTIAAVGKNHLDGGSPNV